MQQFLVPQFIDVENKILGPITVRQFVLMIVTMGLLFIYYKIFDFSLFLVASLGTIVVGAAFAFVKVNGTPFHLFILNVIQTTIRPSLRVWQKESEARQEIKKTDEEKADEAVQTIQLIAKKREETPRTRLEELSLVVNTGGYYGGENQEYEGYG